MSRPLRVEYPNACYHVFNRGDNKRTVFSSVSDYSFFISKVKKYTEKYNVKIFAYALLNNHFHFYLQTPEANLSRFMQSLLTSYSIFKNKSENSAGHIFQGRYKAIIVEHDEYSTILTRYIHLNPVKEKDKDADSFSVLQKRLRKYKWSSYPAVIGLTSVPEWLDVKECYFDQNTRTKQQEKYAKFVEAELMNKYQNPLQHAYAKAVLGSEPFVDRIRRKVLSKQNLSECTQGKKIASFFEVEYISEIISEYYDVNKNVLYKKFSKNNEARKMFLLLSKSYCMGKFSQTRLAEKFGLTLHGYSSIICKFRKKINFDKSLKMKYVKLCKIITDDSKYINDI